MAELRYNIDGTLRKETGQEAEERERWDRRRNRARPQKPNISREDALKAARAAITCPNIAKSEGLRLASDEDRDGDRLKSSYSTTVPSWGWEADRVLFGRGGEAPFRRDSGEYDDFKEFFIKFSAMREKKLKAEAAAAIKAGKAYKEPVRDEVADARHALVLFGDFQDKKQKQLREKITKDRAALPIKALENQITESVRNNRVVLIAADTGAGKSTQVPQYLLAAGFERIACTQPRRIACYSLARRVSYESLNIYGSEIAYQVRFEGTKTTKTKILFLTEGVLLRQYASDSNLSMYNVIIVDEVHERHMNGDFLLGVLKQLLSHREDIRIVLMSATINAELFGSYFNAPVIEVPGRMFHVSIEYLPIDEEDRNLVDDRLYNERMQAEVRQSVPARPMKINAAPYLRIMEKIDQVVPEQERGDLLVFLSGMNEISLLAEELKAYASYTKRWIVLMLHSSLSITEQEKVFDVPPAGVRKCILSTNIAETSVTIDGIRFIIDSGKVKEMGYDAAANLSRLAEFWISRSSAKQRAGRAGRTGPGECYRFYSQREYDRMNEFPIPEILRMPLEPLLLQIRAYGLGDPRDLDFIERPPEASFSHSLLRLQELGALDKNEQLTPLGAVLAVLPLDVVLGKMLVLGSISNLVHPIVVIAAALSVPSPFIRVPEHNTDILANRRALESNHGDPFTLLNVFSEWLRVKSDRGQSSYKWCKRHGVEEQRLYEMVKLKKQFEGVLHDYLRIGVDDDSEEQYASFKRKGYQGRDDLGNKAKRTLNWRDPEYQRKREQQRMLERQKRLQSSGKRKMLRLEEVEGIEEMTEDPQEENIGDMSVDALEFSLKHDAKELLERSDVENLTERDVNLLKLVVCSGLYPHLAVPDEANHVRRATEQAFHTKGKRFVNMHPTSVFCSKFELVQPKVQESTSRSDGEKQTLDTLHARTHVTEMLCYLELLETNKPYLTNVLRVPAVAACLLFGRSIDVAPDMRHILIDEWLHLAFSEEQTAARVLVLANYLRLAWKIVVDQKLQNVQHGLKSATIPTQEARLPEVAPVFGTIITGAEGNQAHASRCSSSQPRRPTDWSDISFLRPAIKRIRRDWEDAEILGRVGDFRDINAEDISAQLGDFLELDVDFTAERLKMQDVPKMFGYDPYAADTVKHASVQVTPYLRYFAFDPKIMTRKMRKRINEEVSEQVDESTVLNRDHSADTAAAKSHNNNPEGDEITTSSSHITGPGRKQFECGKCGRTFLFTPIESLRHRKSCTG